jgi:ribA/ribD-fused uncharacterized protein
VIETFEGQHAFLSNFYPAPMTSSTWFIYRGLDGEVEFPTVEHWLQAHKAITAEDFNDVLSQSTPGLAKRAGRRINLRHDWEDVKDDVMRQGLWLKFSQHPDLAKKLLDTGDQVLQEGNAWGDQYWGRTWNAMDLRWEGVNRLGELLMDVREELRGDSSG